MRNIFASVLLIFLLAAGITHGANYAEYDADAGALIENPTVQGWTESGIVTGVTVEGINDNGTNAWRILDDTSSGSPGYYVSLITSDLLDMYNNGWEFTFTARIVEGKQFCGWGVTTGNDPGWGLTDRERVGFTIGSAYANAFQVIPIHGGTITLAENSANDFHTIRCVGFAQSSQYEFFLDGISYGMFDIKNGSSNSFYDNVIKFSSGSTSGTGREAYWNYVELLAKGISVTESNGITIVDEAGETIDTYTLSLSDQPTDTVTVIVEPDGANDGSGMDIDLGSGPGVALTLQWLTGNWTDIKIVTVRAVDDTLSEGPHQATITHTVSSTDPIYNNIVVAPVVVDINDNEAFCGDDNTIYSPADINRDCYVNLVDFALIAHDWLACTDPSLEECYPYIPAEPMEKIVVFDSAIDTAYPVYRQPAIIVTDVGTILAFCQGRESTSDSAQNDVVLKRSTDGGYTWGPLQLLHDAGDDNLNNIQAVQVKETGRVIVMYGRFPQGCHVSCVQPGYYSPGDDTHHRTYMMYSDDDGLTWSAPSDITSMVREPSDQYMSSPGNGFGFQLRRGPYTGRIIMPFHNRWDSKPKNDTVIYSDDLGETWQTGGYGTVITANPGEVCGVELIDGSIMLNARSSTGKQRLVTTSADGGQAWGQWMQDTTLIEPPCMGTIIRYSDPLNGEISRILFANPASTTAREKGTVRLSYDEAQTWTISKEFVPDYYGYSCLTILPDTRIASFYESDSGFKTMTLAVFSLKWMTDSTDWQGKQ